MSDYEALLKEPPKSEYEPLLSSDSGLSSEDRAALNQPTALRPSGAVPIAGFVDTLAGKLSRVFGSKDFENNAHPLTNLVEQGTREQRPGETLIPEIPQQTGTGKEIAATVGNVPIRFANFTLSPEGVALGGALGLAPKIARTGAGLLFAGLETKAAIQAPTLQEKLSHAFGAGLIGLGTGVDALSKTSPVPEVQSLVKTTEDIPSAKELIPQTSEAVPVEAKTEPVQAEIQTPTAEAQPIEPGFVRLYHGSASGTQIGSDFTPLRDYAQGYAEKGTNGRVYYVDVPADSPFLTMDESIGRLISRQTLPEEIVKQAQPVTEGAGEATSPVNPPSAQSPITAAEGQPSATSIAETVNTQASSPNDFTPALKTSDGTIIKGEQGQTHQNIYEAQADPVALQASEPEHGFVDKEGNFKTRQEVSTALGEAEPMQSERLAELQKPSETGISNERLQNIYGEDSVVVGKGKGAQEWQRIGQADTRDPYAVLSKSKEQGIAAPQDVALLRAEHQRLVNSARDAYGKPEYNELAQRAADMANAIKGVAHGPASDVMRALQDNDVPRYDSPADFDAIVRERLKRESTPKEQETFGKVADELKNGDREVVKSAKDAQNRLRKYQPKETISFDEAAKNIREQIKKLTEPCVS